VQPPVSQGRASSLTRHGQLTERLAVEPLGLFHWIDTGVKLTIDTGALAQRV
jgi:hypothetical protein